MIVIVAVYTVLAANVASSGDHSTVAVYSGAPVAVVAGVVGSLLAGAAFGALMLGISAWIRNDDQFFNILGRFIMMPLFLFSGTFYQLSTLPIFLRWVGWLSPIWHSTELGRYFTYGHHISPLMFVVHFGYLVLMLVYGLWLAYTQFEKRLSQ